MQKFVLDTNLFFNMEAGLGMGQKTEEVVRNMTTAIKQLTAKGDAEFYTAPRIVEEFLSFFQDKHQPFIEEFLSALIVKAPHIHDISISASVFYKLVDDARTRNYRGATIAEEEMQKAARLMNEHTLKDRKTFEMTLGPAVKSFRDRYRQTTRFGFLDSVADLDLIMLAKEIDGTIISSDEGVTAWGRTFGVREMGVSTFGNMLRGS